MTPERWKSIEAVYNELAELPQTEQAARLAAIDDPEIAREVESLLNASEGGTAPDPKFWWANVVEKAAAKISQQRPSTLAPPAQIGPWRIVGAIGKGGMGEVYLAEDTRLGRQVAVKLLPDAVAARPAAIERFRQEARTASALNHPNIVTIHEIGIEQDRHYIVTEFVEGQTIRRLLAGGALPFSRCLAITLQTASALEAAHSAGIVHRDIKPENIMLRPDGLVKVLDFGLAKLLSPPKPEGSSDKSGLSPTVTQEGMILGTPGYISPEQARGHVADARSDLFSLGAVLHETLTGAAPFKRATTIETLAALLERDPPPLSSAGVPPEIAPIAIRLLAKDPAQRYQSATELLTDLRRLQFLSDSGQLKGQPPPRRRWPLLTAAALILIAASAAIYRWQTKPATWFQDHHLTGIPGNGTSHIEVLSPDGRYIAYDTLLPDGKSNLSVRLLAENSVIELLPAARNAYRALAFSSDGSYLYYVVHRSGVLGFGELFFIPVLGGTPHSVSDGADIDKLAISPEGSRLAFVRQAPNEKVLVVSDPDGAAPKVLLRSKAEYAFVSLAWSPDSQEIVYVETSGSPVHPDCRILSIPRAGGTPRLLAHPGATFVYDLAVLPDSTGFIVNAFDSQAGLPQVWHLPRTGPMRHITHDLSQYSGLSLSRDGRRILTSQVGRISELWVVDRDDPTSERLITEPGRRFDTPVWSRDGTIVSARFDAGKWILWSTAPDGQAQRPLLQKSALDLEPSACPDRNEFVFSSGRTGTYSIWRVFNGTELQQLTSGTYDRFPQCIAGGEVVYQSQSGGRKVSMRVPLEGGAPAALSELNFDQLVSPDGKLVLAPFVDEKTHQRRIAVRSRDLKTLLATFPYGGRALAWSPDSKGFADARSQGGGSEIWYQPVDAGKPQQLTHFGKDTIFGLSWSPDGKSVVCSRGRFSSDMVLIQDIL